MDSWVCIAAILFCCGARRQNFRKPQFGVYTVWSPWEFKQFYDVFENSRDLMHLVFKSLHRNRNVALLWLKKKLLRQSSIKHIIRSRLNILRPSLYFSFFKKLSIEYHCSQTFFFLSTSDSFTSHLFPLHSHTIKTCNFCIPTLSVFYPHTVYLLLTKLD